MRTHINDRLISLYDHTLMSPCDHTMMSSCDHTMISPHDHTMWPHNHCRAQLLKGRVLDFLLKERYETLGKLFTQHCTCSFSWMNDYLAIDSGGYLYKQPSHINCSMAWRFPEKLSWHGIYCWWLQAVVMLQEINLLWSISLRNVRRFDPKLKPTHDTSTWPRPTADKSKRRTFHKDMLQSKLISYNISLNWCVPGK